MKRYTPDMYDQINDWFRSRKFDSIPSKFLSHTGFIVPGVAVGFLIETNTAVCFLEPFISNPKAPKELREKSLAGIVEALEQEASKLGYRFCYGIATSPTMIDHGLKRGWLDMGDYKVIVKELP
jgi:hypothetical protein